MRARFDTPFLILLGLVVLLGFQNALLDRAGDWVDDRAGDFSDWWTRGGNGGGANAPVEEGQGAADRGLFAYRWGVRGMAAVVLVSLICGAYSSLIVSNRMAFFSDALAHCAFAGVACGYILFFLGAVASEDLVVPIMVVFGILVGVAIAFVKDQTVLANDTVIGVFFAGAMGLGAILLKALGKMTRSINPENFLFGDLITVFGRDLILLAALLGLTVAFLWQWYNRVVFASFNPSMARSRQVPVRLGNYVFIMLLAVVVNVCLKVVGVLLINALLVVPGATAANVARNLRQFFWWSIGLALAAGVGGLLISHWWRPTVGRQSVDLVSGGVIVELCVLFFFLSLVYRRRQAAPARPVAG